MHILSHEAGNPPPSKKIITTNKPEQLHIVLYLTVLPLHESPKIIVIKRRTISP